MLLRCWRLLALMVLMGAGPAACAPADVDRDGDVDQDDFGGLQRCYSGADVPQTDPACVDARLDGDSDVDAGDLQVLAGCNSGPETPTAANCTPQGIQYFPRTAPWYQDISGAPVDAQSAAVIGWLQSAGGWGTGLMRIDYSIEVLTADETAPFLTFTRTADFYTPDCDYAPVPVPPGGAIEGESGYQCVSNGDCHLIVIHQPTQKLYEM